MSVILVYVTTADAAEAGRIAESVVGERLAACANILPGLNSIYRWRGRVERSSEALLLLKTTQARAEALIARIKMLHSHDCPCIETLTITGGYQPFLDWIAEETSEEK